MTKIERRFCIVCQSVLAVMFPITLWMTKWWLTAWVTVMLLWGWVILRFDKEE